jgi:hypothetical protein
VRATRRQIWGRLAIKASQNSFANRANRPPSLACVHSLPMKYGIKGVLPCSNSDMRSVALVRPAPSFILAIFFLFYTDQRGTTRPYPTPPSNSPALLCPPASPRENSFPSVFHPCHSVAHTHSGWNFRVRLCFFVLFVIGTRPCEDTLTSLASDTSPPKPATQSATSSIRVLSVSIRG